MNEEIELKEGQVVEVPFDKDLVKEYQDNYIMEEEGVGADEDGEVYGTQTTVNTDKLEDLISEDTTIDNYEEEEGETNE